MQPGRGTRGFGGFCSARPGRISPRDAAQHRYMTDENADIFDPYVVRFDNARDPLSYAGKMLEVVSRVRNYAVTKLPKPGESYASRTNLILSSISQTFRQARYAGRFVGGL